MAEEMRSKVEDPGEVAARVFERVAMAEEMRSKVEGIPYVVDVAMAEEMRSRVEDAWARRRRDHDG
jgi:hypothetical protein